MAKKGASAAQTPPPTNSGTIPTETAAKLLMVTPEWVRRLSKDGWIKKVSKDQYRLVDVVQGYINFLKDEQRRASKSASQSRVQDARAKEIELRMAREEGRLVPLDEVNAAVADILGTYRSELNGVPAASTRDLPTRGAIEKQLNDAIDRCRQRFETVSDDLRTGREVSLEGEETDA